MSDLALKLIAENKKTKSPFLDLGNCGLRLIPEELGELVWLESLTFSSHWYDFDGKDLIFQETVNTGLSNKIQRLYSSASFYSEEKLLIKDIAKPQAFSKLTNLKKLWLKGGQYGYEFGFNDLEPLSDLVGLEILDLSSTNVNDLRQLSKLTRLQILNVSRTIVSDLSPLSGFVDLQQLNVWRSRVSDLSPLINLSRLEYLNLSNTEVVDLSPLSKLFELRQLIISITSVNNLGPLSGLTKLQQLFVWKSHVSNLSPLSALTSLKQLDVSNTRVKSLIPLSELIELRELNLTNTLVNDLSPLSNLIGLQKLNISHTQVSELKPLGSLYELKELNFSSTKVSDLRPLSGLSGIQQLDFSSTLVSDLKPILNLINSDIEVLWSSTLLNEKKNIYVKYCPFTHPPTEVVRKGNAAILNYFYEMDHQGIDHLYEAKMLIIGEGGAGKTSLMRRLYQPEKRLPDENESTKGIDIVRHEFLLKNGRQFRLNVWDFGGQEIYHATHQFFLTKRSLYVLLDDTRKDYKSVHDAGFKYWLEVVDLLGDHSPVLIFQNEKNGRSKKIDESGIKGKFNNVINCYRGNLEYAETADDLRDAIEYFVQQLPHIGEELPAMWVSIRNEIEELSIHQAYFSIKNYFDIYSKYLEFDREKALYLSDYLHDLGVFLHFQDDPLLSRIVILQNQWATEAVFKILDDETIKANGGHFDSSDYQRLWHDSDYVDMHLELLSLMQKFELCFQLPDHTHEIWLAPQLMSPSRPENMNDWDKQGDLVLRYHYQFLPKGIVSRLVVRMHRFVVRPELSWSNGVLFERNETELLVEIPQKGGEIVLRARGIECKELLSVISSDLDALNETFHGLPDLVNKLIPCNCSQCSAVVESEFFEQKRLLQRKKDGKLQVECPASYENVSVLELLDGIKIGHIPEWAEDEIERTSQISETSGQTIKIFLASSSELREDRDAFELYFRQQNDLWRKKGVYLKIIRWENFLDALTEKGLQDDYNREVRDCDIFVSLFFTKTGRYTEEEFDIAHQQFLENNKPLMYTFFKDAQVNIGQIDDEINTLLKFKQKLTKLNHYHTNYIDIEHLKLQFKDQLEKLVAKI